MSETTMVVNNKFYRFGGSIRRRYFYINMLIIGALCGLAVGICSLVLGKGSLGINHFVGNAIFGSAVLGLVLASISIGSTYAVLFIAIVFVSDLKNLSSHQESFQIISVIVITGLFIIYMAILAFENVAKRLRGIQGRVKSIYGLSSLLFALSIIPGLGTGIYLYLIFTPAGAIEKKF